MKTNTLPKPVSYWKEKKKALPVVFAILLFSFVAQIQQSYATGNNNGCQNVTNGGTICGNESHCGSYDPGCITNVSSPCGGSGSIDYKWIASTDNWVTSWCISGADHSTYDPCPITQTTWYKRLSKRSCCSTWAGESNCVVKTVSAPPICCISGDGSVCQGGTTTLSGPQCDNYLWSNGATTRCITVGAGTYTLTVTTNCGCSSTCSKCVVTSTPPSCSISGDGSICWGQSTTLTASAGAASYLWNNGATTRCITVSCSGIYCVAVTNSNGCTSSCSKCVTVNPVPVCCITGCGTVCPGGTSTLSGPQCDNYLWSNGATTRCVTIGAGTYTLTVTNNSGCSSTCSKSVVASTPPACTITGDNSFCHGGNTTLSAPESCASYLWNTGATTRCITVYCGGTYCVAVTNEWGCTSSCSKCVTENPLPNCCIDGNTTICHGESTTLTASENASYLWSNGATTRCITVTCGGTYCVTVTNASGCTSNCSKCVIEYAAPTCCITGCTTIYHGGCTQLSAPWGCNSYLWSNGATTRCIWVSCAGNYCVTVSNANGCTASCSVCVNWHSCGSRTSGQQVEEEKTMDSFGSVEVLAFPNPFKTSTTFQFENKGATANAVIEVFNMEGAKVCEIFNNEAQSNQVYKVEWNPEVLQSGVYMYRIVCGDQVVTGRLMREK